MLSLLPQILFLGAFAATLIRLTLSVMFAIQAWRNASKIGIAPRAFALIEAGIAAALFAGAWTQAAAIVAVVALAISLLAPQFRAWPRSTVAMMLIMSITLIVTGAGAFAFDLPL